MRVFKSHLLDACGAWTQERARDAELQRAQLEKSWVLGFVSGANIYGETEILSQLDAPTLYAWVDNYCRSKPLARVYDAAWDLWTSCFVERHKQVTNDQAGRGFSFTALHHEAARAVDVRNGEYHPVTPQSPRDASSVVPP